MAHRTRTLLGVGAAAAGLGVVATRAAGGRFRRRLDDYEALLRRHPPGEVDRAALPQLVRRWLAEAGVDGAAPAAVARFEQRFEMAPAESRPWVTGRAVHLASLGTPAFVWYATADFAPGVTAQVYDALLPSAGFLEARLWGAIPVMRQVGDDTTLAELLRYLAELPWTPLAVLTNEALHWRERDDPDTVEVTAHAAGVDGTVTLTFDPSSGLPVAAEADRPRDPGEPPQPWRGRFSDHRHFDECGLVLPARGEVAWSVDGHWTPYWQGEVVHATLLAPAPNRRATEGVPA